MVKKRQDYDIQQNHNFVHEKSFLKIPVVPVAHGNAAQKGKHACAFGASATSCLPPLPLLVLLVVGGGWCLWCWTLLIPSSNAMHSLFVKYTMVSSHPLQQGTSEEENTKQNAKGCRKMKPR